MSEALEANNPTEAAEAPEAGLAEEANAPESDSGQFDVNAWIVEDEEPSPADDAEPSKTETPADDGLIDVEFNGETHRIPAALKDAFLMRADYTKKTQELAQQRQTTEEAAQQAAQAKVAESLAALRAEHANIAIIDRDIQSVKSVLDEPIDARGLTLRTIDWMQFRAMAQANPEAYGAQYKDLRGRFDAANETLADLQRTRGEAETDLKTKEDQRLQAQREQVQTGLVKRQEETGKVLAQKIEGWSPEKAAEIATYAVKEAGVQPAEIVEMTDPRVWILLHKTMTQGAENAQLKTALKQHQTAANNTKAQSSQPAPKVGGAAATNARRTTDASGDELSAEEWDRRERARVAAKAAAKR